MVATRQVLHSGHPVAMIGDSFPHAPNLAPTLLRRNVFAERESRRYILHQAEQSVPGKVARIEVDKADESVRAYSEDGKLLARYPATIGSSTFPSPSGTMQVKAVAAEPTYYFDPKGRSWGPDKKLTIAAGPNNPIGGTWIDLSKEGYGIHGSPDPKMVGKRSSHGCVRLTNWDAGELARAVKTGATVKFV